MPDFELSALLKEAHCDSGASGGRSGSVSGLTWDSRLVRPGHLFVAIPGEHQDGGDYIADAVKRGAVAVITQTPPSQKADVPVVQVSDAREALARISCSFYGHPSQSLCTVGVTGTNGKTTVVFMIRRILETYGWQTGLLSTVQYEVGDRTIPAVRTTPEAPVIASMMAQMVAQDCQAAVMEVSSHALVQQRTLGIDFDAAVFTNLTPEHLDYHGSMDDYFAAKRILFDQLETSGKAAAAIVNLDDRWGEQLAYQAGRASECLTYGMRSEADVRATQLHLDARGSHFRADTPWGGCDISLRLLGRYNVSNALAAIATCHRFGVPLDTAAQALCEMECVPGRLEEIRVDQPFQVFVDYAHTGDALANVIPALREITSGRLIVVFGCGGDRDATKRPLMGRVVSELADYAFLTSDNPRGEDPAVIAQQVLEGYDDPRNVSVELDRREAIASAVDMADVGDIILIAGKGHETFQEVGKQIMPFDDRSVVRSILGQD